MWTEEARLAAAAARASKAGATESDLLSGEQHAREIAAQHGIQVSHLAGNLGRILLGLGLGATGAIIGGALRGQRHGRH